MRVIIKKKKLSVFFFYVFVFFSFFSPTLSFFQTCPVPQLRYKVKWAVSSTDWGLPLLLYSDSQAEILTYRVEYHGRVYDVSCYFLNCLSQHFSNDFKMCIFKVYWTIAIRECCIFTWFREEANVCTFHGIREHGSILNFNEWCFWIILTWVLARMFCRIQHVYRLGLPCWACVSRLHNVWLK